MRKRFHVCMEPVNGDACGVLHLVNERRRGWQRSALQRVLDRRRCVHAQLVRAARVAPSTLTRHRMCFDSAGEGSSVREPGQLCVVKVCAGPVLVHQPRLSLLAGGEAAFAGTDDAKAIAHARCAAHVRCTL